MTCVRTEKAVSDEAAGRYRPAMLDTVLFDLGVVTDMASIHAEARATMFDDILTVRRPHEGENHSPSTNDDYRRFVDGKSRHDEVADLDHGSPADDAMAETVWRLVTVNKNCSCRRSPTVYPCSTRRSRS